MITFFDLPDIVAMAEHACAGGGEAALVWQLTGAPVLSVQPADPDGPPAQVFDHLWLSTRWPHLTIADLATEPGLQQHFTAEFFPLTDADQLLAILRDASAEGWMLLAVDIDELDLTWYLARSRRRKHPKQILGTRRRRSQHPVLAALALAGFTNRNLPPGLDYWRSERWGPRYQVSLTITASETELTCYPSGGPAARPAWHCRLRADVPADIVAAIAIALATTDEPPTTTPADPHPLRP